MTEYYRMSPRVMAHLDMPEGYPYRDPTVRPEKSKGLGMVIGIVGGALTAGAGWGMMAAAEAAGGSLAGSLAGGAMMAGGAMNAIGAVSGNKKLSQIGGILSLAGGAYGMAFDAAGNFALGTGNESLLSAGTSRAMSGVGKLFSSSASVGSPASAAPTVGLDTLGESTSTVLSGEGGASAASATNAQPGGLINNAFKTTGQLGNEVASGQTIPLSQTTDQMAASAAASPGGGVGPASNLAAGPGSTFTQNVGVAGAKNLTQPGAGKDFSFLQAGKDILSSNGGGLIAGSLLQGMGQGALADAQMQQVKFNQNMQLQAYQNRNNPGVIFYDPNDPNASQVIAEAKKIGAQAQPLSINQSAQIRTPMTAFKGA